MPLTTVATSCPGLSRAYASLRPTRPTALHKRGANLTFSISNFDYTRVTVACWPRFRSKLRDPSHMAEHGPGGAMAKRVRKANGDQPASSTDSLANHELVVLATYLAGGANAASDTEDIAVKANELAPGRFTWRKYSDQINIDTVRKRLWDATKPEKGSYLIGSERTGWRLTKAGFDFAHRQINNLSLSAVSKPRKSKNESASQTREIKRLIQEDAFLKFRNGRQDEITRSDAERFFRIDDYVTGKSRMAKVERFRIIADRNSELLDAINFLSELVREG